MFRRSGFVALAFAASCADGAGTVVPTLAIVAPDGSNPIPGRDLRSISASFEQEVNGSPTTLVTGTIADDAFDLELPVRDLDVRMHVGVSLADDGGVVLVGGSSSFRPGDGGVVTILVGAPGTCATVPALELETARDHLSAVRLGSHVAVVGGVDAVGPSDAIEVFDLRTFLRRASAVSPSPLGATRTAPLDGRRAIVVSDLGAPIVVDVARDGTPSVVASPSLHAGGDHPDAIATFYGNGALLVGGGADVSPTPATTFVTPDLVAGERALPVSFPYATADSSSIGTWVYANDDAAGALVHLQSNGLPFDVRDDIDDDGVRRSPAIFVNETGTGVLVFGGTDGADLLRSDTLVATGCPTGCFLHAGPVWTAARPDVAFDGDSGVIAGGAGPSALVERIVADPAGATIEAYATLVHARRDASVVRLPNGPVLVFGGHDGVDFVRDTEICFPP